ncbi:MAG TPA: hypothetical protein VKE74_09060 [Gemmataceae bacterium]|nr:hypothetical protein [Gemmataceae bacterium]
MRQWIWRRVIAAAAGVFVLVGSAAAQQPAPYPLPAIPVAPAGAISLPDVPPPAASAATPTPPGNGVVVTGNGGCGGCGKGYVMAGGGYLTSNCPLGSGCNNGCGSLRSTAGFVLGPCSSFFDPCGPRTAGHGHGGHGGCGGGLFGGHCPGAPIYGHGPTTGFNPCIYDSYLNH